MKKTSLQQLIPKALSGIEIILSNPEIDVNALDRMVDLQMKMMAHKAKMDYALAMSKFTSLKQPIKHNRKGKTAGHAPFSYTDFPSMVTAISPWLTDSGLSFSHREDPPNINDKGEVVLITVYCTINHVSGHSEEYPYPAIPDERLRGKVSPSQLIQLAITYAKRQTLAMGLGLATCEDVEDDDSTNHVETITSEEEANIMALLDETKDKEKAKAAMLTFTGVITIRAIPKNKYKSVIKGLEERRGC